MFTHTKWSVYMIQGNVTGKIKQNEQINNSNQKQIVYNTLGTVWKWWAAKYPIASSLNTFSSMQKKINEIYEGVFISYTNYIWSLTVKYVLI